MIGATLCGLDGTYLIYYSINVIYMRIGMLLTARARLLISDIFIEF